MIFGGTGISSYEVPDGGAWKSHENLRGAWVIVMINGVLFWMVLGSSSTGAGPPYTHTITPGSVPSFTIQHDLTGTATDWGTQYKGCKISQVAFNCNAKDQVLYANVDWIAKNAAKVAFISTNTPAFPATANESAYKFNEMTFTFGGADYRPNLLSLNLTISPDFITWKDGTRNLKQLIEGTRRKYLLQFVHLPPDSVFWEEALATGNTDDIVIKWTRSANDYIQITLTNCHVIWHDQQSPVKSRELQAEVIVEPEAISVEVKDSIAGNAGGGYGE
jgi:hypothetical protein